MKDVESTPEGTAEPTAHRHEVKPRGDKLTLFLFVFLLAIRQELAGMLAGPFVGRDDDIVRWTRCPTVWTESPVRSDWG